MPVFGGCEGRRGPFASGAAGCTLVPTRPGIARCGIVVCCGAGVGFAAIGASSIGRGGSIAGTLGGGGISTGAAAISVRDGGPARFASLGGGGGGGGGGS